MYIEQYITELTGCKSCGEAARQVLEKTSHLIKARSVAWGAASCIFLARLIVGMGARGFFHSIIPGKGSLVHQILALAFPRLFIDHKYSLVEGGLEDIDYDDYVMQALNDLDRLHILSAKPIDQTARDAAIRDSKVMLREGVIVLRDLMPKLGMRPDTTKVYTEMQMMSYKLHTWGVLDALVEDAGVRRAIIIEWKTGERGETPPIRNPDLAQVVLYALMEAERLDYDDLEAPILEGRIVPVIVRPRGRIPRYSVSPAYPTSERTLDLKELMRKIILAAEHLVLMITRAEKFIDRNLERLCQVELRGRRYSALRKIPDELPWGNPTKDPPRWPCSACFIKDECEYYVFSRSEPDFIDKLAWRSRYAIYSYRENALKPYKEVHDIVCRGGFSVSKLADLRTLAESGNRVDVFNRAEASEEGIRLFRWVRPVEEREERLLTVRQGKPVAVFFNERHVRSPLLRLTYVGRVEEVELTEGGEVMVLITSPNLASRLQNILFIDYLREWPDLTTEIVALETNVDLTQLELKAIDAFQRATKRARDKIRDELKKFREELKISRKEALAELFGSPPWW